MKLFKNLAFVLVALVSFNCSDSDSSDDGDNQGFDASDYVYFISGKVDGVPFFYGQLEAATTLDYNLIHSGASTVACAFSDTAGINYYSGVYPNFDNDTEPYMGMEFVRFMLCTELSDTNQAEVFNDRFPVGDYQVATNNDVYTGTTGAIGFEYAPNASEGPLYNTNGDQTGNSVTITSTTPFNSYILEVQVGTAQFVEGTFSATLYNESDPTDTVQITEGQFKLRPSLQ
ncbi:DUF5025 domain-containing protein [Psychroserpens sp. MEBiC05023]